MYSLHYIVYLCQEPVYHDWVEANDEEEGKEVTKDEEANLGKNKIKAWDHPRLNPIGICNNIVREENMKYNPRIKYFQLLLGKG